MILTKLGIDGYGLFTDRSLDLLPGLQVVAGPNEQGKSTIRHFIGDMLYGQKRSIVQRLYEESNALREPWNKTNGYGGRLAYRMDSGQEIEVQRTFSRDDEKIRVFDLTNARDITGEFPTRKNRESTFAERHLGMTKEVFLGMATISHLTLSELGDENALAKIREKLLSLTDMGSGERSAEAAVRWLKERIAVIGQPAARTKPLPLARARLTDLQKEYEQARDVRREVAEIETRRAAVNEELEALEQRRQADEADLRTYTKLVRAERLAKAEALAAQIEDVTVACFELGSARDFPLDRVADVHRLATLVSTAKLQLERFEEERTVLEEQLEAESRRLGAGNLVTLKEIDLDYESLLTEVETQINRLEDRIKEGEKIRASVDARYNGAQKDLSVLPDFSRFSSNPVEWLNQLANSFAISLRTRDDETSRRDRLAEGVEEKRTSLAALRAVFEPCEDFQRQVKRYELAIRENEDALTKIQMESERLRRRRDEQRSKIPGYQILAAVMFALSAVLGVSAQLRGNYGILIPGVFTVLGLLYLLVQVVLTLRWVSRAGKRLNQLDSERREIVEKDAGAREFVEGLMSGAGCQTVRELEAMFTGYRERSTELSALEDQLALLCEQADEATLRVEQLLQRLRETFARLGQEITQESEVQSAAMQAIGQYQEYRDAKRRSGECREALDRHEQELRGLREELDTAKREELKLSLEVRQLLRDHGYVDEHKSDTALKALRGYRIRSAQLHHNQSQIDKIQGKLAQAQQQIESERSQLAVHEAGLARGLGDAGVDTIEAFGEKEVQAREYHDRWKERSALEQQLNAVLNHEELGALREAAKTDASVDTAPERDIETLQHDIEHIGEEIDAKQKEAHALHIAMTEKAAGTRSLNEIDEERAVTEQRVRKLELELQAASYAISVIEEVTREQHSRIAPHLSAMASEYLAEITGGAYDEVLIDRDMQISTRIPQTKSISTDPRGVLSKGTVDQIYLALRLAMVQSMSENDERIPMLLDDPFANYDDARLARAMKLLTRIAKDNQILLFTCREDVVRVAEETGTPVLRI